MYNASEKTFKQALHANQTGKDQLDDLELDGSTTLKILHGIVSY